MKKILVASLAMLLCSCCSFDANNMFALLPTGSYVKVEQHVAGAAVSTGSGTIIDLQDEGGYILTAAHVCESEGYEDLYVRDMSGKAIDSEIIRINKDLDMCIVFAPGLKAGREVGFALSAPRPGDTAVSISSPYGFVRHDTKTIPIIKGTYSGEYSTTDKDVTYDMYNMRIAPGSSGGMIVNVRGRMIGMTHRIVLLGRGSIPYNDLSLGVKYEDLKKFLKPHM